MNRGFSAALLDPNHPAPPGLLNPDKGIPTRARCAEYGKMHIRGGLLPHPEIPRF